MTEEENYSNNEKAPFIEQQLLVYQGKPWDKQPDETNKWFDRFLIYLRMGTSRSMRGAYKQWRKATGDAGDWQTGYNPARAPENWMEKSRTWNWVERAGEWDLHLFDEEEDLWMERREALREKEFSLSEELIARAKELLDWPLAEETQPALDAQGNPIRGPDGRVVFQKITPSKWSLGDAVRMIIAGDELARRATGSDLQISAVVNIPWNELTREQLRRIYGGEDYEQVLLEG